MLLRCLLNYAAGARQRGFAGCQSAALFLPQGQKGMR